MKLRTLASLFIVLVLASCSQPSSLSSDTSSFSLSSSGGEVPPSSLPRDIENEYDGYYKDIATWSNGEELKNKLNEISHKTYHPLTYTNPNYFSNINADHSYYDFEYLDVIYSETDVFCEETNKGWQREHAFCASLMCGSLTADAVKRVGRATDFHNLLAANASANSSRGNKNYGVADKTADSYQNRTTQNGKDGYSFDAINFEPADKDKGRVARAIFYMAMMYKDDEEDTVNGITMKGLRIVEEPVTYVQGENGAFAIGNLSTLLDWNKKYPVDYLEMQHNISVYKDESPFEHMAQGNRNPFVDYPGLVDYVFGENKDQEGRLNNVLASENSLGCESSKNDLSHYALKEAKRSYEPGSKIQSSDYKIVKVLNNYKTEVTTTGYTNSLADHAFSSEDGETINATITAGNDTFSYRIILNPLPSVNSGEIFLNTTGINKNKNGEDQEVSWGGYDFIFNYTTSASGQMTINNINQDGSPVGITVGSGTKPLTRLVIKTKESYRVSSVYVKAFVGNVNSSYNLTIKIGESSFYSQTVNNKDTAKVYGTSKSSTSRGQIIYIFEGTSSLKINSIAFNAFND